MAILTLAEFRKKQKEEEAQQIASYQKDSYLQKGAFNDGYQFGDVTKTILGTAGDIGANVGKGAFNVVEGVADLGSYLAASTSKDKKIASFHKRVAQEDMTEQLWKDIDAVVDKNSILGEKSDNIAQSIGYIGGMVAMSHIGGALGIGATTLTTGTTFVSAMGNGMSEAYKKGATDEEAYSYGAIAGAGEALSEMIFAGLGKGVKAFGMGTKALSSADDMLAKKISSKISNNMAKNFVQLGVKAGAEGFEEVVAGTISIAGKKLTYMSEEDLGTLIKDERLLDQFVAGAITSGIAQTKSFVKANKAGRDFITDLSTNEQKVIDQEVKDRISKIEKEGKKLTAREKSTIEDEVMEDLKKGYISIDTIENALGGETLKKYQSIDEQETALTKELEALKNEPNTVGNSRKYDELEAKLKELQSNSNKAQLKEQLSKEVSELTADDTYLRESYNEKGRRSQAFEIGEVEYKTDAANKTMQNAVGKMNNTTRAHEFVERLAKISEDKGIVFDFTDSKKIEELGYGVEGKTVNGYIEGENVTLNLNSTQALNKVVGHEITHFLENTEHYDALQQAMEEYVNLKGESEYNKRLAEITERYKDVKDADAKKELLADLVGEYLFTDEKFVRHLSTKNRNVFQKIYDEIKYLAKTFTGTKEGKQLEKVKQIFEEAYRTEERNVDSGSKYSLGEIIDKHNNSYGIGVHLDSTFLDNLSENERVELVKEYVKELGGQVLGAYDTNGNAVNIMIADSKRFKNSKGKKIPANKDLKTKFIKNEVKQEAITLVDELVLTAKYDGSKTPNHSHDWLDNNGQNDWEYWTTYIQDKNNTIWEATLNIANSTNGEKILYDITPIKKVGQSVKSDTSPTKHSISQNQKNTTENQKKSLSDNAIVLESEGNWNVKGKDIAIEAPIAEKFKQVQQDVVEEKVAPVQHEGQTPLEDEETRIKESDARRIKNIEARIQGLRVSRDVSKEKFDESIAKKQEEYDSLKRKDTAKASKLLTQINDLKAKKENALKEIDGKIDGHKRAINNIESQSRARKRKSVQQVLREKMRVLMGDTSSWKDKKTGFGYQTQTLRRNLRDTVRDADGNQDITKADEIYEELQGSYNHHEAELNREANKIKQEFRDLKITKEENVYAQMLGEYRHNPECTLTPEVMKEYLEKNRDKIDTAKVDKIIERARTIYDSLYRRVNDVLREQGMKEIGYREGYFPHFTEDSQNWLAKLFNWKVQNNNIPTDIAGLTEQFTPDRSWQSFNKHRTSDVTGYNFSKGLDTYVQGALDWIYHIEDIQKRRAFENEIRYQHSDKGVQELVDAVHNNPFYDADQMQEEIDRIYKNAKNPLNNFVQDLRKGTNVLAGKKDSSDRSMESRTNRQIYSTMTNISNRVSANMVAGSVSSALTNFIPITQSWGQVSPRSSLIAMKDTILSIRKDDGIIAKSDFLTNRLRKSENLYKTGWDIASEKAGLLMEAVDSFTSQTVWRSKYAENLKSGMNELDAIKDADQFAENVMAGRSRGNMPTIFNEKNLVTRTMTAFQLEVANQYGYMFKDMPQDMKNESIGKLVKGYATMFLGAYAYNALYSSLVGRDAAFDPIGIIGELLEDLGLFGNDEEKEPAEAIVNIATNMVEEIPFVGGLIGGGRIPISSVLPYDGLSVDSFTEMMNDVSEGDWKNIGLEWLNPVYYLLLPFGGGQLRKTIQGRAMFDDDLPIAGSYTNSGKLRFSVEDTPVNRLQAAVFGQYASKNAREYFDQGRTPLDEKKTQELAELDIPISEYWKIQDGLKQHKAFKDEADYIANLDLPIAKKNILVNNATTRKEAIDLTDYDLYEDFEEFDYATKNPGKYLVAKMTGGYKQYNTYSEELKNIEDDKNKKGETISGSKKKKVAEYINGLDATYEEKIILFKSQFPGDDRYNNQILNYINESELNYEEKVRLLNELGFTVAADGKVRW